MVSTSKSKLKRLNTKEQELHVRLDSGEESDNERITNIECDGQDFKNTNVRWVSPCPNNSVPSPDLNRESIDSRQEDSNDNSNSNEQYDYSESRESQAEHEISDDNGHLMYDCDETEEVKSAAYILFSMNKNLRLTYEKDRMTNGFPFMPVLEKAHMSSQFQYVADNTNENIRHVSLYDERRNFYNDNCTQRMTLAMPNDVNELNSLHCFVRKHLLELYVIQNKKGKSIEIEKCNQNDIIQSDDIDNQKKEYKEAKCENHFIQEGNNNEDRKRKRKFVTELEDVSNKSTLKPLNSILDNKAGRVGLRCVFCSHIPRKQRTNMSTVHPRNITELYRYVCTWQRVHFYSCPFVPMSTRDTYWNLKNKDKSRGKTKYWVESAKELGLIDCPTGKGILYCPRAKE